MRATELKLGQAAFNRGVPIAAPMRVLALLLLAVVAAPAACAGTTEVALPSTFRAPLTPLVDEEGIVWFTLDASWAIGRHDPRRQVTTAVSLGERSSESDTLYGIARDASGAIWTAGQVQAFRVADGAMSARALPTRTDPTGGALVGPDGSVWLALTGADKLARYAPGAEQAEVVPTPEGFGPIEMTHDDAGVLYVSGTYANAYARLDPATGAFDLGPAGLAQSPTGIEWHAGALWMGEHGASAVVRVDLAGDRVTRYPTTASPYYPVSGPSGLVVTDEGIVWFAEHFADRIARLDPKNLTLVEYELAHAPGTNTQQVALAPDGRVWYAEWSGNRLGFAEYGNERPSFQVAPRVQVVPSGAARAAVQGASSSLAAASPHESLTARIEGGDLVVDTKSAPVGSYLVLLSEKAGEKTWVGRYVEVLVAPRESPGAPLAVLVLCVAALAIVRRRAT